MISILLINDFDKLYLFFEDDYHLGRSNGPLHSTIRVSPSAGVGRRLERQYDVRQLFNRPMHTRVSSGFR